MLLDNFINYTIKLKEEEMRQEQEKQRNSSEVSKVLGFERHGAGWPWGEVGGE